MSIIIQDLIYEHADRETLFEGINFSVEHNQKVSVIGNNGTGKSTLLRILGEQLPIKSGSIFMETPPYYVPQHFGQYDNTTIAQALKVDDKLLALEAISGGDVSVRNFEILADDWDIEQRVKAALSAWMFEARDLHESMSRLSGGEKTKVFLAGIAIHNPSIVLLDEPTNHLDYKSRERLYAWLSKSTATVVVVSHDRTLLNILSGTYELTSKGLKYYDGNYDSHRQQKEIETSALKAQLESKEKEMKVAKKTKQEITERRQKLDARGRVKGIKMGLGKLALKMRKDRAEKTTSKIKDTHLGKIEDIGQDMLSIQNNIEQTKILKMGFHSSDLHRGKILCEAKGINFCYSSDTPLWDSPLNLTICSGERILLKGNNGSGKTTLLNLIIGKLRHSEGTMHIADYQHLYLDQDYSIVQNSLTVYEQAQSFNLRMSESDVKMNLARSLFPQNTWNKACKILSGGEKMKLVLCCLIVSEKIPDLIILDEPTNNIDLRSIEILTSSIKQYRGTILLVSHDKTFIDQVGIDRVIEL